MKEILVCDCQLRILIPLQLGEPSKVKSVSRSPSLAFAHAQLTTHSRRRRMQHSGRRLPERGLRPAPSSVLPANRVVPKPDGLRCPPDTRPFPVASTGTS